jgi:hypothetical protein
MRYATEESISVNWKKKEEFGVREGRAWRGKKGESGRASNEQEDESVENLAGDCIHRGREGTSISSPSLHNCRCVLFFPSYVWSDPGQNFVAKCHLGLNSWPSSSLPGSHASMLPFHLLFLFLFLLLVHLKRHPHPRLRS